MNHITLLWLLNVISAEEVLFYCHCQLYVRFRSSAVPSQLVSKLQKHDINCTWYV